MLPTTTRIQNALTINVLEMQPRTKDFGFSIKLPYRLTSSLTFLLQMVILRSRTLDLRGLL